MKKLNLTVGVLSVVTSIVLVVAAIVLRDAGMWPDIVLTACMGILCLTAATDK